MIKFLLIVFFFFLGIYYVLILPFKSKRNLNQNKTSRKRAPNSNVDIEYDPADKKTGSKKGFNDGDYIDYEEVK